MKCEEFEREWQELDDSALLPPALEEHRQVCFPCAGKVTDGLVIHNVRELILQQKRGS